MSSSPSKQNNDIQDFLTSGRDFKIEVYSSLLINDTVGLQEVALTEDSDHLQPREPKMRTREKSILSLKEVQAKIKAADSESDPVYLLVRSYIALTRIFR